ncbi:MAG: hypothetical protein ACHQF2_03600 [Flavobacteriales bacterium]
MKTKKIVFKIAAASCFVLLITAFVAYKAGAFGTTQHSGNDTGHVLTSGEFTGSSTNEDSLKKKQKADSIANANFLLQIKTRAIIPSSKSMILIEPEKDPTLFGPEPILIDTTKKDSTKKAQKADSTKTKPVPKKRTTIHSTKSGRIFEPADQNINQQNNSK